MRHPLSPTCCLYQCCILLTLLSHGAIQAQDCPVADPVTPPWLAYPSEPFRHVAWTPTGEMAANVYLKNTGAPLGRPFVFVEGIDFGLSGTSSEHQLGDFGWGAFHGCSPDQYPMMGHMPALLDSLQNRGFHPILVDFEDGSGDIFANAILLADILSHLRQYREDPRPMVVSGASMGGQIARIALQLLEADGVPHCCQLYLSLDSPHAGANVPLGLQQLIRILAGDNPELQGLNEALESIAARQLLLFQTDPNPLREQYQDSLNATAWPRHCRSVAIANGGTDVIPDEGLPLLDYEYAILSSDLIGDVGGLLDLEVHPHPGDPDHPLAGPLAPVTNLVETPQGPGWPWPLELTTGTGTPLNLPWSGSVDFMPGGTRPSMLQFVASFNQATAAMDLPWPIDIPPIGAGQFQPLHSFIPTPSALGIPPPWNAETMNNLASLSPFHSIHHGEYNEPHSEINPANVAFVLDQLDFTECPLSPGLLTGDQVLNAAGDWGLPGLSITGRLCLQSSDPQFGNAAAPPGSTGIFEVHPCTENIDVLAGGVLELGGGPAASASEAHLTLHSGTALTVTGHCILHEHSTLTLEAGATLTLNGGTLDLRAGSVLRAMPGSHIVGTSDFLWTQQPGSQVLLNGNCLLQNEVHWHHFHTENSIMSTSLSAHFNFGNGSAWEVHGPPAQTNWLLGEGALVTFTGSGDYIQSGSGVRWLGHAHWKSTLSGEMKFDDVALLGSGSDSLSVSGDLRISHLSSLALHLAQDGGEYRLEDAAFIGGSTRLCDNRVRWTDAEFSGHPVIHLGLGTEPAHLIEHCVFRETATALFLSGPGRMRIEDSAFESNAVGLHLRHGRAEAACCSFLSNDVAIRDDRALLVMKPEGGGGWNMFDDNDVHLQFNQAIPPEIQGGANHFGSHFSGWAAGSLEIPCAGGTVDWLIHGQSWDWPTSWPQIQDGLWTASLTGGVPCAVLALDLYPIPPSGCGGEGKRTGD